MKDRSKDRKGATWILVTLRERHAFFMFAQCFTVYKTDTITLKSHTEVGTIIPIFQMKT